MKKVFLLVLFILSSTDTFSQSTREVPYKLVSKKFDNLIKRLDEANDNKSIRLAEKGLNSFHGGFERYWLLYYELSYKYADKGDYEKCLEVLQRGQDEGLFYFRNGFPNYPEYRIELQKLAEYEAFLVKNESLRKNASINSKTEFMVRLPNGYDQEKSYPLLIAIHGGMGNIQGLQEVYNSDLLNNEFIVAYFQGSELAGSFQRVFARDQWVEGMREGIQQVLETYAVDRTKVVLAGQSAGGIQALTLGLKNLVPTKGIVLSFPLTAKVDSVDYMKSAERGLRIALICGENDWAIDRQKELAFQLDRFGVPNRLLVFPDLGHSFAKDWEQHFDSSLRFVLSADK